MGIPAKTDLQIIPQSSRKDPALQEIPGWIQRETEPERTHGGVLSRNEEENPTLEEKSNRPEREGIIDREHLATDKDRPFWLRGETISLIAIAFLGILFIVRGLFVANTARQFFQMMNQSERFEHNEKTLARFSQALNLAESGEKSYLLTGDLSGLESYNQGISRLIALKAALSRIGETSPYLSGHMETLLHLAGKEESILERSINLSRTLGRRGAIREFRKRLGDGSMDRIQKTIQTVSRSEKGRIERSRKLLRIRFSLIRRDFIVFGALLFVAIGGASLLIFRSAQERDHLLSQLAREATRDFLTGLPNRNFLMKTLFYDLAWIERSGKKLALLYIDLDGFKEVNDQFGHAMGDKVLIEVSARFSGVLRGEDLLCRLGGDEFVVVLRELADISDASSVAMRLIGSLSHPAHSGLSDIPVSASIGIAIAPENGITPESLLKASDQSMYQAKLSGKGRFVFFSEVPSSVGTKAGFLPEIPPTQEPRNDQVPR